MAEPGRSRLRTEIGALLALGGPLVLHNLANMGMQFTDTLMAGRFSPQALAAVAVGGNLWLPVFLMVLGVLMGLSPTVAHLYGAGESERIGGYVRQGFWLSQLLAWSGFWMLRHTAPVLVAIGIDPTLIPVTDGYLHAIAWGMPAISSYLVLRFASEGIAHTRPLLLIAVLGLGVNALADYALVYGAFGLPRMGAVGCGWASAAVMWTELAALVWYVRRRSRYRPLGIFNRLEWPRWAEQAELLRLGAPIAVSIVMEGSMFAGAALLMGTLGTDIVAGHQVAVNFASIAFMVPMGLALAISVRVGQAVGRGDRAAARYSGYVGMAVCMGCMAVSASAMLIFPSQIAAVYTEDPRVAAIAVSLLTMAAIFQLSDGLQVGSAGALRGLKDTRIPMFITILAYWVIGFPLAYYLGIVRGLGPRAVWVGLIAGLSVAAVLLSLRYRSLVRGWHLPTL